MDLNALLKTLDSALAPTSAAAVQHMTQPQFEAYAADQIAKAAKEADAEDDKEKKKSRKRLEHLRAVTADVLKASWDGDNGTQAIPIYQEPGLTADSEYSETTMQIPLPGNQNTMADGVSTAAPGGTQNFAKSLEALAKSVDSITGAAPSAAPRTETTKADKVNDIEWPGSMSDREYLKTGIAKNAGTWGRDNEAPSK